MTWTIRCAGSVLLVLHGVSLSAAADVRYVPVYPGGPANVFAASPNGRYIVGRVVDNAANEGWFLDAPTNYSQQASLINFPKTYLNPISGAVEFCRFFPNAVNNSGLVVGSLMITGHNGFQPDYLAASWDPHHPSSIDILAPRPANYSGPQWVGTANDINSAPFNEIAGSRAISQGTVWNEFAEFDTSPIIANAINDNRAIVGYIRGNAGGGNQPAYQAFYGGPTPAQLLGYLPGYTSSGAAVDITDDGQIVGTCYNWVGNSYTTRAFYMHDANAPMLPLSIPFYPSSQAVAVNHAGTVVGTLSGSGSDSGFVWTAGSEVQQIAGLLGGPLQARPVSIASDGVITAQYGSATSRLIPYSTSMVDILDPLLNLPPGSSDTATPSLVSALASANHEVSVVFHTPGSSFTHVVIPLFSVPSGDSDFQLAFNGLTYPLHVGQDFSFLDYAPNGVEEFTLAGLDLGTFGQIGNPLRLLVALKYLSDASGVPTTADPLFAVAPEPSSYLLACVGILMLAANNCRARAKRR